MRPGTEDHLRALEAEIARMQRRLDRIPARWHGSRQIPYVQVSGGNLVLAPANLDGILYTGTIASVPTATPVVATTYADGLGCGYLNGSSELVWLCNADLTDASSVVHSAVIGTELPAGQNVFCLGPYSVPIAGGGGATALVYLAWRI